MIKVAIVWILFFGVYGWGSDVLMNNNHWIAEKNGRTVMINIPIEQELFVQDQFVIYDFFDREKYSGYKLLAIDIAADARYNTSSIFLVLDSESHSASVGTGLKTYRLTPRNDFVLNKNSNQFLLQTRGDLYLQNMILYLSAPER